MKRILSSEYSRMFHSKAAYVFLACVIAFIFINIYHFDQAPLTSAEQQWNNMSEATKSMYRLSMGFDKDGADDSSIISYIEEVQFYAPFSPELWVFICAAFVIFLYGRDTSGRHINYSIYQGKRRTTVLLSRSLFVFVTVFVLGIVDTVLMEFLANRSWTHLPFGYLLRCFILFAVPILQFSSLFIMIQYSIKSSIGASVCIAALSALTLLSSGIRNAFLTKALGVVFPFVKGYRQDTIWASSLTPELIRELWLTVAWSIALTVLCNVIAIINFKKRELQ